MQSTAIRLTALASALHQEQPNHQRQHGCRRPKTKGPAQVPAPGKSGAAVSPPTAPESPDHAGIKSHQHADSSRPARFDDDRHEHVEKRNTCAQQEHAARKSRQIRNEAKRSTEEQQTERSRRGSAKA